MTASAYAQGPLSDEKQILRLEDDWVRGLETRDRKLIDKILARDFTFIEPDGTIKNRDEYLADRSSDSVETEAFENVDLKVHVLGNFAVASGLAKITEPRQGEALPIPSSLEGNVDERQRELAGSYFAGHTCKSELGHRFCHSKTDFVIIGSIFVLTNYIKRRRERHTSIV
jgi:hypothetical protein